MKNVTSTVRGDKVTMPIIASVEDIDAHLGKGVSSEQALSFVIESYGKWQLKRGMATSYAKIKAKAVAEKHGMDWKKVIKDSLYFTDKDKFSVDIFLTKESSDELFTQDELQAFADQVEFPKITCGARTKKPLVLSDAHKDAIQAALQADMDREVLVALVVSFGVNEDDARAYLNEEGGEEKPEDHPVYTGEDEEDALLPPGENEDTSLETLGR